MTLPAVDRRSTAPATFFNQLEALYTGAVEAAGGDEHQRRLGIGGQELLLRFAGSSLVERIMPAFRHLELQQALQRPAQTVSLWDSVSTGVAMPPPPWTHDDYRERSEVRGFNDGRFRTAYSLGSGTLSMLDKLNGKAVFWVRDADTLAYWESGAPLLNLLHWWFGDSQKQLLHAAAIGSSNGGVLLVGKGGSGKSTTALAALLAGMSYAGDDYCLVDLGPPPRIYSLFNSAKLTHDNLQRFPQLGQLFAEAGYRSEEKALVFLARHYPAQIVAGFPLKAVFLPQVSGREATSLEPVSPAAALKALAPSTLFQLSGAGHGAFRAMASLVQQVPCHRLNLGTDLAGVVQCIAGYLQEPANSLRR